MPDPFESVRWKIWRAHQHVEAVKNFAQAFFESNFYTFATDIDRQGRLIVRVTDVMPVPGDFATMIGDAAHNLRGALDHLIFILARPQSKKEEGNVEFPLCSSRKKFAGTRYKMPGVRRGVRTLIESLQPYHSRKWPQTALLGQLRAINNWDKHRKLVTAAAAVHDCNMNLVITGTVELLSQQTFRGVLKPGAILARFKTGYGEAGSKVEVKPHLALIPIFDHPAPKEIDGIPIVSTLGNTGDFIQNTILPMFAKFG